MRMLSRCAIEPAESDVTRKPHRTLALEEKDYDPGFEAGDDFLRTAFFCPEPVTPRKSPAPLPLSLFVEPLVAIGGGTCVPGLSCPLTCPFLRVAGCS
jgi:hypothetical protein